MSEVTSIDPREFASSLKKAMDDGVVQIVDSVAGFYSAEDIAAHVSSASDGLRAHAGDAGQRIVVSCRDQDVRHIEEAVRSMSDVQIVPYGDLGVAEIRGDCAPLNRGSVDLAVHEIENAMRVMSEASRSFTDALDAIERQPSEANRLKRLTKRTNKKGKKC